MEDVPQPGSLEAEAGVFCSTFDMTGTRLITGGADKTIKVRFVGLLPTFRALRRPLDSLSFPEADFVTPDLCRANTVGVGCLASVTLFCRGLSRPFVLDWDCTKMTLHGPLPLPFCAVQSLQ